MKIQLWMRCLINKFKIFNKKIDKTLAVNKQYEKIMEGVTSRLKLYQNDLLNESDDGRINSALSETKVIEAMCCDDIQQYLAQFNIMIDVPKTRNWYDVLLRSLDNKIYIPINIKISNMTTADNVSSKIGLAHALTGIQPNEHDLKQLNQFETYFTFIKENINYKSNADYDMLIVDKKNMTANYTSLKTLNCAVPNGNNLPFQCKWIDNIGDKRNLSRTTKDSCDFLLQTFNQSLEKQFNSASYGIKYIGKIL